MNWNWKSIVKTVGLTAVTWVLLNIGLILYQDHVYVRMMVQAAVNQANQVKAAVEQGK